MKKIKLAITAACLLNKYSTTFAQELTGTDNPLNGFDVGYNSAPTFVDIDGDGDLDLVSGQYDGTFKVFKNDGNNAFTEATGADNPLNGLDIGSYVYYSTPTFVDIDGDGDLDLVSGGKNGTFKVFKNDGNNAFTEAIGSDNPLNGFYVEDYSTPTFVDIDGDGDLDLVSGGKNGTFKVLKNDGNNNFTEATGSDNPLNGFNVGTRSAPTFVDIDGDGDLDLVSGQYDGTFKVFKNDGNNAFTEATGADNPLNGFNVGTRSTPTFVDIDGDGDLDLVSGEENGTFKVFNTGIVTTLPVELTTFSAEQIYSGNLLSWTTVSEINNEGFAIQRSTNGVDFEEIAFVNGNGTTNEEQFYNYTDTTPVSGINYYRLKQVDYDGAYEYSDIISVQVDGNSAYSIYPSATTDVLHISQKSSYSIINSQGQEVLRGIDNRVDVSTLPSGMYFIRLENGAIERFSKM